MEEENNVSVMSLPLMEAAEKPLSLDSGIESGQAEGQITEIKICGGAGKA